MKLIEKYLYIVIYYLILLLTLIDSEKIERKRDEVYGFSLVCTQYPELVVCKPSDSDLEIAIHQNSLKSPLDIFKSIGIFVDHLDVDDVAITFRTALKFIVSYISGFQYYHLASYLNLYELYLWKMQRFIVSKEISENENQFVKYSQENLTPNMLPFKEFLSLTFIITVPSCLDEKSCETAFIQSQQLILFLKEEIKQVLHLISRPRVFISMAFSKETFDIYSQTVFERILQLLKQFTPYSLGIDIGYFFISPDNNEDIRGGVFQEIFSQIQARGLTEFYVLFDENILIQQFANPEELSEACVMPKVFSDDTVYNCSLDSHNFYYPLWSLTAVRPLLFQGFSKMFGFSISFSSALKPKTEIFQPLVIAFSQKHLAIFSDEGTLFRFDHSKDLNNYLYFQLYRQFHSLYCNDISYAKQNENKRDFHCSSNQLSFLFNSASPLQNLFHEDYIDYYLQLYRSVLLYFEKEENYKGVYEKMLNAFFQFGELSNLLRSSHFEFFHRQFHYSRGINEMILGADIQNVQKYLSSMLNTANNLSVGGYSSFLPNFFGRKFPSPIFLDSSANDIHGKHPKVAVITALYTNYDQTCKPFTLQTIPTHFICFTDELLIRSTSAASTAADVTKLTSESASASQNHWIVDSTPYHLDSLRDEFIENQIQDHDINALHHNMHPFNIAKFYKLSLHQIPILSDYDYVIWIDGSVSITNANYTKEMIQLFKKLSSDTQNISKEAQNADYVAVNYPFPYEKKNPFYFNNNLNSKGRFMILFEHIRNRNYILEGEASMTLDRYTSVKNRQFHQSYQNITKQLREYLFDYFLTDFYFEILDDFLYHSTRPQYGLWCTCMIAFDMKKSIFLPYRNLNSSLSVNMTTISSPFTSSQQGQLGETNNMTAGEEVYLFRNVTAREFLKKWSEQNRIYSTQDQVSFPFVVQQLQLLPFSLPDADSSIYGNANFNSFFIKYEHGM